MKKIIAPITPFLGVVLLLGALWAALRFGGWPALMLILLIAMAILIRIGDAVFYGSPAPTKQAETVSTDVAEEEPK